MKIFAASDLHLSFKAPYIPGKEGQLTKPMDVFGGLWTDYPDRLAENWQKTVSDDDLVLIPGDISWAMNLSEACYDLAYISALSGRKIISRGNHDYWWDGIGKVRNALPAGMNALQHDTVVEAGYAICATRGWMLPSHNDFKESQDRKIYDRELLRLGIALDAAKKTGLPVIVMLHYPPVDENGIENDFTKIFSAYPVKYCVYGHIHGNKADTFEGEINGVTYINVSVDRLGFCPRFICENR